MAIWEAATLHQTSFSRVLSSNPHQYLDCISFVECSVCFGGQKLTCFILVIITCRIIFIEYLSFSNMLFQVMFWGLIIYGRRKSGIEIFFEKLKKDGVMREGGFQRLSQRLKPSLQQAMECAELSQWGNMTGLYPLAQSAVIGYGRSYINLQTQGLG